MTTGLTSETEDKVYLRAKVSNSIIKQNADISVDMTYANEVPETTVEDGLFNLVGLFLKEPVASLVTNIPNFGEIILSKIKDNDEYKIEIAYKKIGANIKTTVGTALIKQISTNIFGLAHPASFVIGLLASIEISSR